MKIRHHRRNEGIALVLTLAILVIATILILGFASSMRTERQASASMASNETATLVIQAATDHAISILDRNIPQPVPPGGSIANPTNWIINPGLLTTIQGTAPAIQIPLSSNPSITYTSTNQDAELNVPQLSGSGYTILPTSASMRVGWIPVLRDPTAPPSAPNKLIGRYAFWVDDENSKINLNTAQGKPASLDFTKLTPGTISVPNPSPNPPSIYPLGHPSSVNLDVLDSTINAASLSAAVGTRGGITSIDEIKAHLTAGTVRDVFLNSNKFYLTAYNRDPEFNVFGKSRLHLFRRLIDSSTTPATTLHPLGHPLFQVFRDLDAPMYFHGDEAAAADTVATYYTASSIAAVLNRNDWPGMPARSFVQKWGGAAPGTPPANKTVTQNVADREADQIAWNMVSMGSFSDYGTTYSNATSGDYVKFENNIATANPTPPGNMGTVNYPNAALVLGPISQKAIVPTFPRPLINEVCLTLFLEPFQVAGVTKYQLKVWLQTELWLGPGYPDCDFSAIAEEVGLTYLSYTASQDNNSDPNLPIKQEDTKYIKSLSADPDGIRSLFGAKTTGALPDTSSPPSRYAVVTTQGAAGNPNINNKWIYLRPDPPQGGFSSSPAGTFNFEGTGMIHLDFKMRLFEHSPTPPSGSTPTAPPCSLVPVWDARDPKVSAANTWNVPPPASPQVPALAPPADDPKDYIEFQFDLDPSALAGGLITRSLEVADPRLGGLARMWRQAPGFTVPTNAKADTLGGPNSITSNWDTNKLAFVDFSNPTGTGAGSRYRPSVGMFSLIPTGMQRGLAGSTLKLQPSGSAAELPDWLLLDLLSPTAEASNYADLSLMNSTAGKINLNGSIYPNAGSFAPSPRWQPLQAVFQNMSAPTTVAAGAVSPSTVVHNILKHQLSTALPSALGIDFGAAAEYDYPGEVCEIAGVADAGTTDWDKEQIVRYVASNLTTKSNVFSVWGVGQTIKKNSANNNPANQGLFETRAGGAAADDIITGEKRFEAMVERYVWPGNDAIAGQGHVRSTGTYDQLSTGQTKPGFLPRYAPAPTWERIDGPDAPTYPVTATSGPWNQRVAASYPASTTIENANNPLRAFMKYRVVYFRYLND